MSKQFNNSLTNLIQLRRAWCVAEAPEVWANSSVYTLESLSQTKTNTLTGASRSRVLLCDGPVAFEVPPIALWCLFMYSCSFLSHETTTVGLGGFGINFSTAWNNVRARVLAVYTRLLHTIWEVVGCHGFDWDFKEEILIWKALDFPEKYVISRMSRWYQMSEGCLLICRVPWYSLSTLLVCCK